MRFAYYLSFKDYRYGQPTIPSIFSNFSSSVVDLFQDSFPFMFTSPLKTDSLPDQSPSKDLEDDSIDSVDHKPSENSHFDFIDFESSYKKPKKSFFDFIFESPKKDDNIKFDSKSPAAAVAVTEDDLKENSLKTPSTKEIEVSNPTNISTSYETILEFKNTTSPLSSNDSLIEYDLASLPVPTANSDFENFSERSFSNSSQSLDYSLGGVYCMVGVSIFAFSLLLMVAFLICKLKARTKKQEWFDPEKSLCEDMTVNKDGIVVNPNLSPYIKIQPPNKNLKNDDFASDTYINSMAT